MTAPKLTEAQRRALVQCAKDFPTWTFFPDKLNRTVWKLESLGLVQTAGPFYTHTEAGRKAVGK